MKKRTIGIGVVLVIVLVMLMSVISGYNGLVAKSTAVDNAQSKVDVTLQRRYDLIPNIVASVKGYMTHESQVFESIAASRAKIGSATTTEQEKMTAQGELTSAISRLLVVTENYPELKANAQVQTLITELEGAENRVFVARNDYNAAVTEYNKTVRTFPTNVIANVFGFSQKPLFQIETEAKQAPKVDFSTNRSSE